MNSHNERCYLPEGRHVSSAGKQTGRGSALLGRLGRIPRDEQHLPGRAEVEEDPR